MTIFFMMLLHTELLALHDTYFDIFVSKIPHSNLRSRWLDKNVTLYFGQLLLLESERCDVC